MSLQDEFPNAQFSPPATEETIADAEAALGIVLPKELRTLYLECDGFREDIGNAKYLFSLLCEDRIGSLVAVTKQLWNEAAAPCLKQFVFFGSSSGNEYWGISLQEPYEIIAYHHHMEDRYEIEGASILSVWKADYALYDEIDQ